MLKSKKLLITAIFISTLAFSLDSIAQSPTAKYTLSGRYPMGRIFLNTGEIIDGKNIVLQGDTVSMEIGGVVTSYQISNIRNVMVKKGRASIFAQSCGGGCLGLFILAYAGGAYEDSGIDTGQLAIGFAFWIAVSAGIGYIIGYATDEWNTVYFASGTSRSNSKNIGIASSNIFGSEKNKNGLKLALFKYKF